MTLVADPTLTEGSKCPKCGTPGLGRDPEGDLHCWACSTTFLEKPPQQIDYLEEYPSSLERQRFYEDNKTAILADVQSIGAKATAKKWRVNGASLHHVLTRWRASTEIATEKEVKAKEIEMKSDGATNIKARSKFYDDNKAAIIADLLHLGKSATRGKWRIPKGTLPRLIEKWLSPEQVAIMDQVGMPAAKPEVLTNGRLPPLPPFSDLLDGEAQVKWLEIYDKLLDRHSSENG